VLSSSKTSGFTKATGHNISEDAILHSHRRENLKSYLPGSNLITLIAARSFVVNLFA
jgi:hypothetical protein